MALMLALNSPELDVRAITVVPGNVAVAQGLDNGLRLRLEDSGQMMEHGRQRNSTSAK
jgi:inosine-uridine nucleoside N-ribohydrolase